MFERPAICFLVGRRKISMFLKALARDLYKSQKEVEGLEQKLLEAAAVADQEQLKEQLRQAKAELEQIRKVMEGRKEQSRTSLYKPKSRF
jgi:molecular chaperone GrpE (heat shock protein)